MRGAKGQQRRVRRQFREPLEFSRTDSTEVLHRRRRCVNLSRSFLYLAKSVTLITFCPERERKREISCPGKHTRINTIFTQSWRTNKISALFLVSYEPRHVSVPQSGSFVMSGLSRIHWNSASIFPCLSHSWTAGVVWHSVVCFWRTFKSHDDLCSYCRRCRSTSAARRSRWLIIFVQTQWVQAVSRIQWSLRRDSRAFNWSCKIDVARQKHGYFYYVLQL